VVLLDYDLATERATIDRIGKLVLGEYSISTSDTIDATKVHVDAAVGPAEWKQDETAQELIERARLMWVVSFAARQQADNDVKHRTDGLVPMAGRILTVG